VVVVASQNLVKASRPLSRKRAVKTRLAVLQRCSLVGRRDVT